MKRPRGSEERKLKRGSRGSQGSARLLVFEKEEEEEKQHEETPKQLPSPTTKKKKARRILSIQEPEEEEEEEKGTEIKKPRRVQEQDLDELLKRLRLEQPDRLRCDTKEETPYESKVCGGTREECADLTTVCGAEDKAKKSAQGEVFVGCPQRDTIWKRSKLRQMIALHPNLDEPHDLVLFEKLCQVHVDLMRVFSNTSLESVTKSVALNLVTLADNKPINCWYCLAAEPESVKKELAVDMIQERVNGISLAAWLRGLTVANDRGELSPGILGEVLSVLLQVLGAIWGMYQIPLHKIPAEEPFYHNDVHPGNIFITVNRSEPVLNYNVAHHHYILVNPNKLVKFIDYGTMTRGYPLNARYRPINKNEKDKKSPPPLPLLDICHAISGFTASFEPLREFFDNPTRFPNLVCFLFQESSGGFERTPLVKPQFTAASATIETIQAGIRKMMEELLHEMHELQKQDKLLADSELTSEEDEDEEDDYEDDEYVDEE